MMFVFQSWKKKTVCRDGSWKKLVAFEIIPECLRVPKSVLMVFTEFYCSLYRAVQFFEFVGIADCSNGRESPYDCFRISFG